MSVLSRVTSVLPMLGYAVLPLVGDGVVKGVRWVASKWLPKSDPFHMRRYELGVSTLLGAVLIWRAPVNRIPVAVMYLAYKCWDVASYYRNDYLERREEIVSFFLKIDEYNPS